MHSRHKLRRVSRKANAALAVCVAAMALGATPVDGEEPGLATLDATLRQIVRATKGEIGVSLVHVESGAELFSFNGSKPFAMASVYKLPIAFEALAQISERRLAFDQLIVIRASDVRDCCALSRRHPQGGITVTLRELLELMIIDSDNMMGVTHPPPEDEWTLETQRRLIEQVSAHELRAARDRYTRDPRDTATPDEMTAFLVRLQRGELLPQPFNQLLLDLLERVRTGPQRLKGRLPPDTVVAHKTGTTAVVINDVGIITLPDNGGHLALAVFVMNGAGATAMQRAIAQIAAAAYEAFTGKPIPPPPGKAKPARRSARDAGS
jgi:beta-lactamase class A